MTTSFVRKKLDSYRELGQPLAYHLGRTRGLGWLTLYFFLTLNPVIEYINSKLINKTGVLIDWDIDVLFQESGWHLNSAALSIMLAISFPIFISVYSYISGENSLVQEYIKKHFHRRDILNLLYGSLLLLFTHSLLYVIPFYLYGFFVLFNKSSVAEPATR